MKTLGRAFAIMVVVNVVAFCWMGQYLGDWDPFKLDTFVRRVTEHWYGPGPQFWISYALGLPLFETVLFLGALLLSKLAKGAIGSAVLASLAVFGLIALKAWDIQRNVDQAQKQVVKTVENAVEQTAAPVKDTLETATIPVPTPQ